MAVASNLTNEQTKWLEKVYKHSSVSRRYSVLPDFSQEVEKWTFWNKAIPTTKQRNEIYIQEAPKLAHEAASKAIDEWGQDPKTISHIIFVSCTGVVAPGVQAILQETLGLNADVNQFGLNMMGCFGAFKGLDMAAAFAKLDPTHRVLVVCTELCSLHFQQEASYELQIGNALFADGGAACIVGMSPTEHEKSLWRILKSKSLILPNTKDKMTWKVCDTGFVLGLKAEVPLLIQQHAASFVDMLLPEGVTAADCLWPIHPGGKNILQAVEAALNLDKSQTQCSWDVLEQYGNVSSPTFLFVLDRLRKQTVSHKWSVGLGFGPGLSFEGVLLENA